jgi:hypothetical protein
MQQLLAAILAAFAVVLAYALNTLLGGVALHHTLGVFLSWFPATWMRLLVLALPFAIVNLGFIKALQIDPAWGGTSLMVSGILVPAAVSLRIGHGRLTLQLAACLLALIILGIWIGLAMRRAIP